jgi:phospholipid/cholesterol/gamma-HCH transport system ATP-binding protein
LLVGLLVPNSGSVLINGRAIVSLAGDELRIVRAGFRMVFEDAALLSSISVRDNLALPLEELTRKTRSEMECSIYRGAS